MRTNSTIAKNTRVSEGLSNTAGPRRFRPGSSGCDPLRGQSTGPTLRARTTAPTGTPALRHRLSDQGTNLHYPSLQSGLHRPLCRHLEKSRAVAPNRELHPSPTSPPQQAPDPRSPDTFSNSCHEAAAQPRVGERPSVSWLVEATVVNSTRRAQIVPTCGGW